VRSRRTASTTRSAATSEPGRHETSWNGLDDGGARVMRGIYFIRSLIGPERRTVSIVYLNK